MPNAPLLLPVTVLLDPAALLLLPLAILRIPNAALWLPSACALVPKAEELAPVAMELAPTAVLKAGVPRLVLGSAGSNRIRSAILQTIVRVVDEGRRAGEAIEALTELRELLSR